ncbi:MAG: electron transfer flavoprotein subunit alpha/FixB family protein, partial [Gammaproteobacteria bacterium]
TCSIYENKVYMEVVFFNKSIVILMLRGAMFELAEEGGVAKIVQFHPDLEKLTNRWSHLEFVDAPESDIDISKAEFIVSIGRGIGDEENVTRFAELAENLGATLGCSRPLADSGWLPKPHQVGLSGKSAGNCKLYLALGISGAVQHLHGMKHVDTIIAVNIDPNAPIFNVATYGVCGDVFEFTDALEKCI